MPRKTVDLSSHFNQTVIRGHPADFPVSLRPLSYLGNDDCPHPVPNRLAVVREDTGEAISLVSDRYTFVPHQRLLSVMEEAITNLDVGPVPRGIYVDRRGARMRAIFKFPALSQALMGDDDICPCVQISNTYDGTSRVQVSIGAFRFVCTNLAVGGGGVFASGFMSVHAGEIPVEEAGRRLTQYLCRFDSIAAVYRAWMELPIEEEKLVAALTSIRRCHLHRIWMRLELAGSVFSAYNAATAYATHQTRSAALAFALLELINRGFQSQFPVAQQA